MPTRIDQITRWHMRTPRN